MPCSDNGHRDRMSNVKDYNDRVARLTGRIKDLESWLCAILSQINDQDAIKEAEGKGECRGLFQFWEEHKTKDRQRLKDDLNKYSEHEKVVLLTILESELNE